MHQSFTKLKPLVNMSATSAFDDLIKKSSSPASVALGNFNKSSVPASASLCKLEPLISLTASSALEEMMKASPATAALGSKLTPVVTPASLALDRPVFANSTTASPATAALDQMFKASSSALDTAFPSFPAIDGMDDSFNESSRKRVKKSPHETPRRASMTHFSASRQPSAKFDTTDLFQALQGPSNKKEEFNFPSLTWDLGDDDEVEEDMIAFEQQQAKDRRRSISASCLLGKRPRGGLVRSKTMKAEVDRLVLQHSHHHHQTAFPCRA